mmetsp:Transcript_24949/g.98542  ORF Transcript_24949/g.98542 Transcript_24949/m.98542 type:complete len:84 (+) Transcript_24949:124-375(+)
MFRHPFDLRGSDLSDEKGSLRYQCQLQQERQTIERVKEQLPVPEQERASDQLDALAHIRPENQPTECAQLFMEPFKSQAQRKI